MSSVLGAVHVGVKVYCSFTVHAPPLLCTLLLYCARSSLEMLQLKHLKQVLRGPSLPAWSFSAGMFWYTAAMLL